MSDTSSAAGHVQRVGVVGAGTMGLGIAQAFAQAGFDVLLHDTSATALDRARQGIEKSLAKFVEKGRITAEDRDATLGRLTLADALDALAAVDLAVEAIVEAVEAKRALFAALDRLTPHATLLASNTSSISITVLGAATTRPDRILGLHFMNPVPLMPLVELVRGHATSDETMAVAVALTRALGKTGIDSADYPASSPTAY